MTPIQFEQLYQDEWAELETMLASMDGRTPSNTLVDRPISGARIAWLYRRACEHLALARARAYPAYLVDRLEAITADGHQAIYHHRELGFARLRSVILVDFPSAVRRDRWYVAVAAATFVLPMVVIGLLVYWRPELILSVVSADTAESFDQMYSPNAPSIGRFRMASTDWMMFGYYIRNNVGIAFQCFAGGLFAGLGSLFFLAFNGAFGGAIAGYLTERGLSSTFYSFVATHSAFELTAIVLSGAAGLRIGHSWLAPARLTRRQALVQAASESVVLIYGFAAMLLIAAAIEAFWSSAAWLPHAIKYGVAAICWAAVIAYFVFQGRRAG